MPDSQNNEKKHKKDSFNLDDGERIAKFLARAGVASRRESERLIAAGQVQVNGTRLTTPAFKVTAADKVVVDGVLVVGKQPTRLWRYNKPSGLVTSHKDEQDRKTVFETLPKDMGRVISVGRLDITSEGLLLLTNDGALARALELPSTGWARRYRARAFGVVTQEQLDTLKKGIKIDGILTRPIEAVLEKQQRGNAWISVTIREGKNREVRRALDALGLKVNRLIRTSYGPFQLGTLAAGEIEAVKPRVLQDQVGHLVDIEKTPSQTHAKAKPHKKGSKPGAKKRNYPQRPDTRAQQSAASRGPNRRTGSSVKSGRGRK